MLNVTHLRRRRRRRQVFSSDNIVGVVSNVPMMSTPGSSPCNDTKNISSSAMIYPIRQQHAKQRQQIHSSPSLSPPIITITHECLLIPVAFGLWWYWTKRKARKVYKSLLRIAPACSEEHEEEEEEDDPSDLSIHNHYYYYNYNASISSPNHTTNKFHTDNDIFQSWNDVEASCQKYPTNSSTSSNPHDTTTTQSSSSMRWVRWIKSSSAPLTGSSTSRKERQVRIMTLQNLRQQQQQQQHNRTTSVRSMHATSPTSRIQDLALSPPITQQQQEYHIDPYPSSWECIPDTTTTHPFTSSSSASAFTTSFYQHMEDLCFVQPSNPATTTAVAGTTTA
jgi:hypothetical protein